MPVPLALFFDPNRILRTDTRHNYGENRYQLFGMIEGRIFVVVDTPRPHAIRLISARKANKCEVACYEMVTNQNGSD
jgi:uncharacterized DUF497 family protein